MKQLFTLVALVLSTTMVFAQTSLKSRLEKKDSKHPVLNITSFKTSATALKSSSTYTQKLESIKDQWYSQSDESWNDDENKYDFSYNDNNLMDEVIYYTLSDGEYQIDGKGTYEYDSNGNMTYYYEYNYDESTGEYETSAEYMETYTYDSNNNMLTETDKYKSNGSWITDDYNDITYDYDTDGSCVVTNLDYSYDSDSGELVKDDKDVYSYDADGNFIDYYGYGWGGSDWELVNYIAEGDAEFNSDGNLKQYIFTMSDGSKNKGENTYDSYGNCLTTLYYSYDEDAGAWVADMDKMTYEYDFEYLFSDLLAPVIGELIYPEVSVWYDYPTLVNTVYNKPTYTVDWDDDDEDGELEMGSRTLYIYADIVTTSVKTIESDEVTIYPNPVSTNAKVTFSSSASVALVDLYNVQGTKVLSKEIENGSSIEMEEMAKGVYLYQINVDGVVTTGKLVKK